MYLDVVPIVASSDGRLRVTGRGTAVDWLVKMRRLPADAMLGARVASGRILEGHGDLRPEHVYLGEPPAIIDCLEFSAELRWLDAADEVGFLALECERARAAALGCVLLHSWREASGDTVPDALLHFYQSCRACSRARLAIRHLREARYRGSPVWRRRAMRYLALAERHLRACQATLVPAAP